MTLIEDIQTAAVDSGTDLAALLRKCKLLAARLGSDSLEEWVQWESDGYPDDAPIPKYRVWSVDLKGHFSGPYGSDMRNAPIPYAVLPEKVKNRYANYECRQSIASLETLASTGKTGSLTISTGDLAVFLGENVYQGQNCVEAWGEVPHGSVIELVNAVRNRILDFSLAIWKESPEAGEVSAGTENQIDRSQVTQIFNTAVYGGAANLVGSASQSTVEFGISANDFTALQTVLNKNGISLSDIDELKRALDTEPEAPAKGKFGPNVSQWISTMVGKAASGSWSISLAAAGNLLATVIGRFYGIGD